MLRKEQQERQGHVDRSDSTTQSPRKFKFFACGARSARANQLFSDFLCPTKFLKAYGQHFPKTVACSRWSPRRGLQAPRDFCKMRWRLEWSLGIRTDLEQGWKRLLDRHGS
jgi:hypothetical protein